MILKLISESVWARDQEQLLLLFFKVPAWVGSTQEADHHVCVDLGQIGAQASSVADVCNRKMVNVCITKVR